MQSFMIKRLRVSGAGKIDGVINFTDGLNIIQGQSNTGKTWILNCIYYLFGSDTRPYSPLTGYTDIEGVFLTKRYGKITISRKLDEKEATVVAESKNIENGKYATNYKRSCIHYLNDLWLRIIGIDETIKVPKNAHYARTRMSWANIASVFFADENEIDKSKSIVLRNPKYNTSLISSLYFLITGDYKEGIPEITRSEAAAVKKEAAIDYIEEQVALLTKKRVSYVTQLEELAGFDVESQIQEFSDYIQEIQQAIKELIEENTVIVRQMTEYQQEDVNCCVLVDRYESLISQYKADLQRLNFISKGEKAVKDLPKNEVCPFCGGELHPEDDDSYLETINAEIKRIASELTVIAAAENSLHDEQKTIRKSIEELQARRAEVNRALDDKNHEIQNYKFGLQRFKDYTTLQNSIDFVNNQLAILVQKKNAELRRQENFSLYHVKQEFKNVVGADFDMLLNKILRECNYWTAGYASWDFNSFDILMDGESKSEDQDRGYRSFLNSVVALMLYEYFNSDYVLIKPGFLMIDTPLLGFDENEFDDRSIKNGLYQYFINHQGDGQIIIVDNLNVIPKDIDFEAEGINVVTYHKDEKDGHIYGFMPSWRRDLPKESL